jgi:hypothetical protein
MTQTISEPPRLTDAQVAEMLALTKGADSVELKLTVPDAERRTTISALGIDALDAQIRQVFFFDTPDLVCNAHGVVVRARRVQGRGDDSVIKLRPVEPGQLSAQLRRSPNLVVEVDAMPGGFVCSASMKGVLGTTDVKEAAAGDRKIRKLYSKEQRSFFDAHAPTGIGLGDLSVLGPITVLKAKFAPAGWNRRPFVAELWFYPDGSRILELSTKCAPTEAFQVTAEAKAFLTGKGVDLAGDQQTKTKTALEFFAEELSDQRST